MNLSEPETDTITPKLPDEFDSESAEDNRTGALFAGDTGELTLDTRRVLAQLLIGPSLDGQRHTQLWPVLLRDEKIIRQRLADLFLELVIDYDQQVAFPSQADTGDMKVPLLLRRARLTFVDSVLLLYLRLTLTQAQAHGERAVVSRDEIIEHLGLFERAGNTDKAGFSKRVDASVEKFKDRSILQKIRSSDERYEVSPTLKLLFSADEILELTSLYRKMAEGGLPASDPGSDEDRAGDASEDASGDRLSEPSNEWGEES